MTAPGRVGVIADNTWRAFEAAKKISFDWAPAPFPATMDEHWQALSDSFTEESLDSRQRDDGDPYCHARRWFPGREEGREEQVGIAGHLKIGSGTRLAAQSGIMKNIGPGQEMMGSPAVPIKDYMRQVVALKRLSKK